MRRDPPAPSPAWSPSAARERVRAEACRIERALQASRTSSVLSCKALARRLGLLRAFPEIDLLNERAFLRRWNAIAAVGSGKPGDRK